MKRPVNVDFTLDLRIIGKAKSCLRVCSDEGDGYEFIWKDTTNQDVQKDHYQEWAEQLEYVVAWLKQKAGVAYYDIETYRDNLKEAVKLIDRKPNDSYLQCIKQYIVGSLACFERQLHPTKNKRNLEVLKAE